MLRLAAAGGLGALAGCGGSGQETPNAPFEHPGTLEASFATNGDYPADEDPADGRPPTFPDPPAAPDADPSTFQTLSVNDETVRLAPLDVVVDWYRRGEVRVVDARGIEQYTRAHVYGAVLSTAQQGSNGGVIPDWPTGDRVVTYCGCPHHLSSVRAAGLQKAGFSDVFAIDEGFGRRGWSGQRYPMAGTTVGGETQASVSSWTVTGSVDARHAGEYVWARAGRQYEAGPVASDGSYELTLHFWDVSATTPVELQTPGGTVTEPLGDLGTPVTST
jgi:rhodanese-related sulfurtransferase